MRQLRSFTRQQVKDHCGFDGGHQGPQTLGEAMTGSVLQAVGAAHLLLPGEAKAAI
jgi:hypothetical protein